MQVGEAMTIGKATQNASPAGGEAVLRDYTAWNAAQLGNGGGDQGSRRGGKPQRCSLYMISIQGEEG